MAILDGQLRLSAAQALTTQAAVPSTNVYDTGAASDRSINGVLKFLVSVAATFTSAGAGTLSIAIQGSVDNSAWTTYLTSSTFALANLVVGRRLLSVGFPGQPSGIVNARYWRLLYTVGGADFTGGSLNADIVLEHDNNTSYPAGINPAV